MFSTWHDFFDMHGGFKDLTRRTASEAILCDKAFDIAENPKYDGYQRVPASRVCNIFNKKSASLARLEPLAKQDKSNSGGSAKNENMSNKELAEDLHKPIIGQFKKRKGYSFFINRVWVANLDDMQLINK